MDKLTKVIAVIVVLVFVLVIAVGCPAPESVIPPDDETGDTVDDIPAYHIGIVTLGLSQSEDEYRGAEALVAEFGSVDDGGIIKHVVLPSNAYAYEVFISIIAGLADDPLMKAVIVNQGIEETADAFQKIRAAGRGDIILMVAIPQDAPKVISKIADVVVGVDYFSRDYYDILRAKNMGAKTFVFMSFTRHMNIEVLARRRNMYEEACKDLGIEFVFETVPDPMSEISRSRHPNGGF